VGENRPRTRDSKRGEVKDDKRGVRPSFSREAPGI
jgi:hypothetical protein